MRPSELARQALFQRETCQRFGMRVHRSMQKLERARALRHLVMDAPDGGHTPATDLALQAVAVGDQGPFSRRHVLHRARILSARIFSARAFTPSTSRHIRSGVLLE
jgi:hypothetical protein